MRKRWSWLAVSALVFFGGTAEAATVLDRSVQIEIRPDGSVRERERLRVRLEVAGSLTVQMSTYGAVEEPGAVQSAHEVTAKEALPAAPLIG